ncbi:MAG: hypothetical protein L6R41_000577, partial [Letrouitia leprolyta]
MNVSNSVAALCIVPAPVGNAVGALIGGAWIKRTKRYKTLSILASTISTASFVAILLRWRGRIEIWESLYLSPAALAIGLLNSSQFVALSAAVEKEHLATIISTYFLSLQLGILIGASASASLLRVVFGTTLAG